MNEYRFEITADLKLISEYANHLNRSGQNFIYYGHINNENDDKKLNMTFGFPIGSTKILYGGYEFIFELIKYPFIVGLSYNTAKHEELYLTILCETKELAYNLFEQYLLDASKFNKRHIINTISRMVYKAGDGWKGLAKIHQRDISTVYLDSKKKNDIVNDIQQFYQSKNDYLKYGIPHTRKYLLEGPPGTGKTSLICALASMLNKNIAMIGFNQELDDAHFMKAVSSCPSDYVLVLEDIDAIFEDGNKSVTMSGILNILDGFGRKDGMVVFMTTNHFNKLSKIFIRPGRVDYILNFSDSTKTQIEEMFNKFFPDQNDKFKKLYSKISDKNVSMAVMQKFFFENRNCDDISKKTNELLDLISLHSKKEFGMYG